MKTILRLTVPALLVLLASACPAQPAPGTPISRSAPSSAEPEMESLLLDEGFQEVVWRWDTPEGKLPEKPEQPADQVAEFRRRFTKFCTDVGIVKPDGNPLPMEGDVPNRQYVQVAVGSREWQRIRELNHALARQTVPQPVTVDLLVLEVPAKLARQWGLDGLPPGSRTPSLFADGVPAMLEPEDYAVLRRLILGQPGARVFAAASATVLPGVTALVRRVTELSYSEGVAELATKDDGGTVNAGRASEYCVSEPRDVGVVLETTVTPSCVGDRHYTVEASIVITGVKSWLEFGKGTEVRVPSVWRYSVETLVTCRMGQTLLLSSASQNGEARTQPPETTPRDTCLLSFLTPRQAPALPQWPRPEDYTSPAGCMLLPPSGVIPVLRNGRVSRLRAGADVDWGDDDDDDGGDSDAAGSPDAKESRDSFCLVLGPNDKVIRGGKAVVLFGSNASMGRLQEFLDEERNGNSRPVLCQAAAIEVSPALWLKLSQELGTDLMNSRQSLDAKGVQAILRAVAQDHDSSIIATTAVCTLSGRTAILGDVVELLAPYSYRQQRVGGQLAWFPEFGDAKDVGTIIEVTPYLAADHRHVTLELGPEFTEFAGWQPLGSARGLPQYRCSTVETQVVLECGQYMLLGGGGKPDTGENLVIWLIGVDRMGW